MIEYIVLNQQTAKDFNLPAEDRILAELGTLNVFVGKNNSGKSRLLRKLFSGVILEERNMNSNQLRFWRADSKQMTSHFAGFANKIVSRGISFDFQRDNIVRQLKEKVFPSPVAGFRFLKNLHSSSHLIKAFDSLSSEALQTFNVIKAFEGKQAEFLDELATLRQEDLPNVLYIPILRGLRPVQMERNDFTNEDVFSKRTQFDYFDKYYGLTNNSNDKHKIYSGLSMYEDIKKMLLGTEDERTLITDFQLFLETHIFHERVTLIPKYDEDVLHIKVGDTPQREIYNLGDGLQTIISILFPVFMGKDQERMVFIEEPEAHLHPAWQNCLLNALLDIPNQQYFITTHSTAFINDPSAEVFSVSLDSAKSTRIEKIEMEDEKLNVIRDLGYKQSDLLQANYILWVEGYSDKVYLEYWISQLASDLKEGVHYTIMFFGGSSFSHLVFKDQVPDLSFVRTINRNLGIIMDSDRKKRGDKLPTSKSAAQQHFTDNGLFCWITSYREIENYIPKQDFLKAIEQHHKNEIVEFDEGEYVDRNSVCFKNSKSSYRATITLSEPIFRIVQKNGDGSLTNVKDEDLRRAVQDAIAATNKVVEKIDKIEVAKKYVGNNPNVPEGELTAQLEKLIEQIRLVNNLSNSEL